MGVGLPWKHDKGERAGRMSFMGRMVTGKKAAAVLKDYREMKMRGDTKIVEALMSRYEITSATVYAALKRAEQEERQYAYDVNYTRALNGEPIDYALWAGKVLEKVSKVLYEGDTLNGSEQRMVELVLAKIDKQNRPAGKGGGAESDDPDHEGMPT